MTQSKLTSHKLEFQNPTFQPGATMITVRNGPKWSRRVYPGMLVTVQETDGEDLGEAEILGTMTIAFGDIPEEVLGRNHDVTCRVREGLRAEMIRVYPSFEEWNVVTVIFFVITERAEAA